MVKARTINVVDLNEIRSVDTQTATHTETVDQVEPEPVEPEPVEPCPKDKLQPSRVEPEPVEQTPPTKAEQIIMKKGDEKATCAFCSKTMSVKALRYSHDKNCKGKTPAPAVRSKSPERPTEPCPKVEEPQTPRQATETRPAKAKLTRAEVRQQRLNSLVSQAFEIKYHKDLST